jgi:ribonuclease P protein component
MHFSVPSREAKAMCRTIPARRAGTLSLKFRPGEGHRYSVVVAKRYGNAVRRNRVKRVVRELMREKLGIVPAGNYLIYMNVQCDQAAREVLAGDLDTLLHRIAAGNDRNHARVHP